MCEPKLFLDGCVAPLPDWIALRAGPLAVQFDPGNLALRRVRLGEREILRSIYAAVRDRNWGTVQPHVSHLQVQPAPDSFSVSFEARCLQDEIDFLWKGTITGDSNGSVRFDFDGQAHSRFWRSRIGICVLHPLAECAGRACWVEHVDGSVQQGEFPRFISPSQPFFEIRALTHEVVPGLKAEVRFEGEVFEMEDQRNWTDASFKTYGTPLERPFPVRVERGTRIQQAVRLVLLGAVPPQSSASAPPGIQTVSLSPERPRPRPPIGLGMASHGQPLTGHEVQRLKLLQPDHLRADLPLAEPGWRERLALAADTAKQLGAGLHLALHLSDQAERELEQLLAELEHVQPRVLLWLVFHCSEKATSVRWVQLARRTLTRFDARVPFAAGTNAYFAELNRSRPVPGTGFLPCYSINPQVHAGDPASLVENLGGQADTVETAWRLTLQPVVVSPITMRPRFNPNATSAPLASAEGELPFEVDLRQMSLFGAAWTLGSIAQLSSTGYVHSLTYYETTGWRGVMETEAGSPLPQRFPSIPGAVFPVFHVLADLAGYNRICPLQVTQPLSVVALALLDEQDHLRLLIGSFEQRTQSVCIRLSGSRVRLRVLDGSRVGAALRDPEGFRATPGREINIGNGSVEFELSPLAVACLDRL